MRKASELRDIAQAKLAEVECDLSSWSEDLAQSLADWCEQDAEEGEISSSLDDEEVEGILPSSMGEDDVLNVINRAAKILEDAGYKVIIL